MAGLRLETTESAEAQLLVSEGMISNESRVREIRTLGSISGERKRGQGGDLRHRHDGESRRKRLLPPPSKSAPLLAPAEAVDALAAGLAGAVPDSCRLGEYLARFNDKALKGLQACVRSVSAQVVPSIDRVLFSAAGRICTIWSVLPSHSTR